MSVLAIALLAATPLVSAINYPRQASASATATDDDSLYSTCVVGSVTPSFTGTPEFPSDVDSYIGTTATDYCSIYSSGVPASISSDFVSFTSAYSSWINANSAGINAYASSLYSFQQSAKSLSECSALYAATSSGSVIGILTTPSLASTDLYPSEIFGCATGASGASATASGSTTAAASSSGASSTGATTTSSTASGSASGASAASSSSSTAGAPGARAPSTAGNFMLYLGGSIALTTFVGMLAL